MYGARETDSNITLDVGEDNITSIHSDGVSLFVGLNTSPGKVVKIDVGEFTKVETLTFGVGEDSVRCLVSDGTYLYAGLFTSPGQIVKIEMSTFSKVSTLSLAAGEDQVRALYSDGAYLYAGLDLGGNPAKVARVDLSTFTETSVVTFGVGELRVSSLSSDGNNLYAGLDTGVGRIVKIGLATFSQISTLVSGTAAIYSLAYDGYYLYAGTSGGGLAKVDLSTFTVDSTLAFSIAAHVYSMFFDGIHLHAGLYSIPARVARVDLTNLTEVFNASYGAGYTQTYALFSDGTYLYTGFYSAPGRISRRYISPIPGVDDRKSSLLFEQIHSGLYSVYPTLATGTLLTSNVAAWTKGNYAQVVPASTISTTFYITGVVLFGLTANTEYEVDIATGAAASESVVATVFHKTDNANLAHECLFPVPIKVSSNARISARCADGTGGLTCLVKIRYKT